MEVDVGGIDDGINGTTMSQSSACSSSNNFSINPDHYDAGVEDANTTENEEDEEEISGNIFDHRFHALKIHTYSLVITHVENSV